MLKVSAVQKALHLTMEEIDQLDNYATYWAQKGRLSSLRSLLFCGCSTWKSTKKNLQWRALAALQDAWPDEDEKTLANWAKRLSSFVLRRLIASAEPKMKTTYLLQERKSSKTEGIDAIDLLYRAPFARGRRELPLPEPQILIPLYHREYKQLSSFHAQLANYLLTNPQVQQVRLLQDKKLLLFQLLAKVEKNSQEAGKLLGKEVDLEELYTLFKDLRQAKLSLYSLEQQMLQSFSSPELLFQRKNSRCSSVHRRRDGCKSKFLPL